jgi:hypothetical protein
MIMTRKSYSELIEIPTFIERYRYLKLNGRVGEDTFGFDRYLNQAFYNSREWEDFRDFIITRDLGCDLGIEEREINGIVIIHHINPITVEDVVRKSRYLLDPENAICVSDRTHRAIHYSNEQLLLSGDLIERTKYDTCPWKQI